jgi:hypothetical protein
MAVTINADNGAVSGSAGLKSSADSTGVLALQTNGTTAVTVDASQNVGIGTASPSTKLHVKIQNEVLRLQSDTASSALFQTLYNSAGTRRMFQGYASSSSSEYTLNNEEAGAVVFATAATERMRVNAGAPILCLSGGNTSATGTGIAFPSATSASSDPNTLDDYEEGTFTPTITSGSGTITTVGAVTAVYTKIGNIVLASVTVNITTNGTAAQSIIVNGLPFAATAIAYIGAGRENASTGNMLQLYLPASQNNVTIKNYNDSYPAGSGFTMFGTISYRTS